MSKPPIAPTGSLSRLRQRQARLDQDLARLNERQRRADARRQIDLARPLEDAGWLQLDDAQIIAHLDTLRDLQMRAADEDQAAAGQRDDAVPLPSATPSRPSDSDRIDESRSPGRLERSRVQRLIRLGAAMLERGLENLDPNTLVQVAPIERDRHAEAEAANNETPSGTQIGAPGRRADR